MKMYPVTSSLLFALGVASAYGWKLVPPDAQADVWNASGAALRIVLLILVASAYRSATVALVASLLIGYDIQVAGCTVAYMLHPWPMDIGDEQCSSGLGIPLGAVGLMAACLVAAELRRRNGR